MAASRAKKLIASPRLSYSIPSAFAIQMTADQGSAHHRPWNTVQFLRLLRTARSATLLPSALRIGIVISRLRRRRRSRQQSQSPVRRRHCCAAIKVDRFMKVILPSLRQLRWFLFLSFSLLSSSLSLSSSWPTKKTTAPSSRRADFKPPSCTVDFFGPVKCTGLDTLAEPMILLQHNHPRLYEQANVFKLDSAVITSV